MPRSRLGTAPVLGRPAGCWPRGAALGAGGGSSLVPRNGLVGLCLCLEGSRGASGVSRLEDGACGSWCKAWAVGEQLCAVRVCCGELVLQGLQRLCNFDSENLALSSRISVLRRKISLLSGGFMFQLL